MIIKKTIGFAALVLIPAILIAQTKTFKGAWFEIKYPSSFTSRPSLKSATATTGYESAFFQSPDGLAEFYIYSPQWNGTPSDISVRSTEKMSGITSKTSGNVLVTWWTISAKNGSYTRTYQETMNSLTNTNWITGIKYKNQSAYAKYKRQYLAFKASLVQFAD